MFYYIDFQNSCVTRSPVPPTKIDKERIKKYELIVIDGTDDLLHVSGVILPITKANLIKDDQGNEFHIYAQKKEDQVSA